MSKASVNAFTSSNNLSKGRFKVAELNSPSMSYAGLNWNFPSIITSKPLSANTSFSYFWVVKKLFIFLILLPIGGDIFKAAIKTWAFSLLNSDSPCCFLYSINTFFIVETTAPAKPDPRRIVSIILFPALANLVSNFLDFFSIALSLSLSVA